MTFSRVIPRDLFNESKLLKCLGVLSLRIHEGAIEGLMIEHVDIEKGFAIELDAADSSLFCTNLTLFRTDTQTPVYVRTPYNSKSPYPLIASCFNEEIVDVFDDSGAFTDEFRTMISD